jgi:Na+/H+ antiporter NhaD/arsenite permease-like protein
VITILSNVVVTLTYVGLGLGYFPGLQMNRASIALVGAALLIALGVLDLKEAWQAIDAETIVFLLSMMIISTNLAYAGFFRLALTSLVRYARSPFVLLVVLTFGSGFLSALFLNDTIALILTPLVLSLTQKLNLNPIPYLLALAGATNLGSVATISGNPQNLLIGSLSKISYLHFAQALTPLAVMSLVIQIGWLWWLYPEVRSLKLSFHIPVDRCRVIKPLLVKSVLITSGLLIAFLMGFHLAGSALFAAALLLITRRIKPQRVLPQVDWELLVMFSGLFIVTAATQKLGLVDIFTQWTVTPIRLLGVTVILSNLISNVPAVLVLQQTIVKTDTQAWLILAAASTLAGNLTLLGSVANLIVAEAAAKRGYRLTFWEHLRFGLPLTIVTLLLVYPCVWLFN